MRAADLPLYYNAVDILERNLPARANKVALYSNERELTFGQVAQEANQVGNAVCLNDLGVDYMLTGSVAMSSYVPARATMDIDVIIEIDRIDINAFQRRFSDDYYIDSSSIRRATTSTSPATTTTRIP